MSLWADKAQEEISNASNITSATNSSSNEQINEVQNGTFAGIMNVLCAYPKSKSVEMERLHFIFIS
jgi:hypothetical protein